MSDEGVSRDFGLAEIANEESLVSIVAGANDVLTDRSPGIAEPDAASHDDIVADVDALGGTGATDHDASGIVTNPSQAAVFKSEVAVNIEAFKRCLFRPVHMNAIGELMKENVVANALG